VAIAAGAKIDVNDFSIKTWTPSFTNVTLGSGNSLSGWYTNVGGLVSAGFYLVFGTSPAFTGSVILDLPVAANVPGLQHALGSWVLRDTSTVLHYSGTIAGWDSGGNQGSFSGAWNSTTLVPAGRLGSANVIGSTGGPAIASGDILSGQFNYRAV